jgi:hypothetical protein
MSGRRHEAGEWDRIREAGRIAADRRARAAAEAERGRQINATPQTLARRQLRRDAVAVLRAGGYLRANQVRAAEEILRVYVAITRHLFARVARYGEWTDCEPPADWAPSLVTAYRDRYVPWREAAGREKIGGTTLGDLALLIVVDNCGIWQAGARAGVHGETARAALQRALYSYCRVAGWLDRDQLAAEAAQAA